MNNYIYGPKKLYVIGNGFGIHHGIKCNYTSFCDWLKANRQDVHKNLIRIYGDCDGDWWSNFEENLTNFDPDKYPNKVGRTSFFDLQTELIQLYGEDGKAAIDEFEMKDKEGIRNRYRLAEVIARFEMGQLKDDLNKAFGDWVEKLEKPKKDQKIDWIDSEAFFFTFNYTRTLEDLYGVDEDNVLHIHGSVDNHVFVIGHNMTIDDMLQRDTEQYAYDRNPFDDMGEDEARLALFDYIADELRKPVEEIIEENKNYFNDLLSIKEMTVLGFSYSPIDLPYLKRIIEVAGKDIKVILGWHDEKDEDRAKAFKKDMNLSNCELFEF